MKTNQTAWFHLPGLFEFYPLYDKFLPLFYGHREYFYDWCGIGSIYGAPGDCIWGGGRIGYGDNDPAAVKKLCDTYGISARLTFSNSLLRKEHLVDPRCNRLCALFEHAGAGGSVPGSEIRFSNKTRMTRTDQAMSARQVENGIIITSDLLLDYIRQHYPAYYFVSSTTKVLTKFEDFRKELDRPEFRFAVPDFRLNKAFSRLEGLTPEEKDKTEFLVNECCSFGCPDRKACYEAVSRLALGEEEKNCFHGCTSPDAAEGYVFSKAMKNPGFISVDDIRDTYLPMGFSNFKIEGRSLGSALILEFLLYYLTKPGAQLKVREAIYLDNTLDLF